MFSTYCKSVYLCSNGYSALVFIAEYFFSAGKSYWLSIFLQLFYLERLNQWYDPTITADLRCPFIWYFPTDEKKYVCLVNKEKKEITIIWLAKQYLKSLYLAIIYIYIYTLRHNATECSSTAYIFTYRLLMKDFDLKVTTVSHLWWL